jgi:signal transduction histidine kinase
VLTQSSRLRDWGLFFLVALLPTVAVGVLGLRALRNEEAAVGREMKLQLENAAESVHEEWTAALAAGADPSFAEHVTVPADADDAAEKPAAKNACDALAADLAHDDRRAGAAARILAECRGARTSGGRMLWLLAALDPEVRTPAAELQRWLSEHAADLAPAERAVARDEIAGAAWLGADKERLAAALAGGGDGRAAQSYLGPRRYAMRAGRPLVEWRDARSLGRLVRNTRGDYDGFVVHPGSIARALRAGWPELAPELRAFLVVAPEPGAAPAVELLPGGAHLVLAYRDADLAARRTQRSRLVLAGVAAFAGVVAVALAALLFARMRAERRLSALRTDFVAAVSHELRTPIASLRMLSELLAEKRVDEAERPELEAGLAREAKRLAATVERLLGFSRMEAKRQVLRREPADVAALVAEAAVTFEERHPEAAPLERALEPVTAAVDADAVRMAVDNLLANALKYAPDGKPYRVEVAVDGGGVRIAVADHGPGIARRDRERIFRPFERADDRLSRATEGSGIGLTLVRHVALGHGGRAFVESEPGRGATFVMWLPREREEAT